MECYVTKKMYNRIKNRETENKKIWTSLQKFIDEVKNISLSDFNKKILPKLTLVTDNIYSYSIADSILFVSYKDKILLFVDLVEVEIIES